jgi:hypothetical protein
VVVIAPTMQEGSEIELDWKVELKGMDELPSYLITERSSEIELTDEEMLAIPAMLHCTPWHEINTVLQGVIADPAATADPTDGAALAALALAPAADATDESVTVAPAPEAPSQEAAAPAPQPAPATPWGRARHALGTSVGRFAVAMAALAAILFLALLLRPTREIPLADAPPAPLPEVTGVPTGGADSAVIALADPACLWSGSQLVGKRYDQVSRSWLSVAEGGAAATAPEIVVALEQVSTCSDEIRLTWSVQNNSDRAIEFPLRSDNIRISDGLGNEYRIDDSASDPQAVRVAPGAQERGTAVVSRPLSRSATSLLVRLKEQPFGEASFVVALSP